MRLSKTPLLPLANGEDDSPQFARRPQCNWIGPTGARAIPTAGVRWI